MMMVKSLAHSVSVLIHSYDSKLSYTRDNVKDHSQGSIFLPPKFKTIIAKLDTNSSKSTAPFKHMMNWGDE